RPGCALSPEATGSDIRDLAPSGRVHAATLPALRRLGRPSFVVIIEPGRLRSRPAGGPSRRPGNLKGRATTHATDQPVLVVRYASRGGGKVLRLHLQEFEDRENCSLRRSRTWAEG